MDEAPRPPRPPRTQRERARFSDGLESLRSGGRVFGPQKEQLAGDTDATGFDGDYDGTDESTISGWAGASLPYRAYVDIDLDGDVDTTDAGYTASDSMGWDVLSRDGSTIGYAGYVQDSYIPTINHVRHRAMKTDLGRWVQRDPAGYVDGASLYEYVRSQPIKLRDPMGLVSEVVIGLNCVCEGAESTGLPPETLAFVRDMMRGILNTPTTSMSSPELNWLSPAYTYTDALAKHSGHMSASSSAHSSPEAEISSHMFSQIGSQIPGLKPSPPVGQLPCNGPGSGVTMPGQTVEVPGKIISCRNCKADRCLLVWQCDRRCTAPYDSLKKYKCVDGRWVYTGCKTLPGQTFKEPPMCDPCCSPSTIKYCPQAP